MHTDIRFFWLYGPAGSGKSAILQSIAELFFGSKIAASFFFGKGKYKRAVGRHFFPTIAYQLANNIPGLREHIDRAMRDDPTLPRKCLRTQLQFLIIEPMKMLSPHPPYNDVVVIDGLDECSGDCIQQDILRLISQAVKTHQLPLRFLIASRPEPHIREVILHSSFFSGITKHVALDEKFNPKQDIRKFLQDGFNDIRKRKSRLIPDFRQQRSGALVELLSDFGPVSIPSINVAQKVVSIFSACHTDNLNDLTESTIAALSHCLTLKSSLGGIFYFPARDTASCRQHFCSIGTILRTVVIGDQACSGTFEILFGEEDRPYLSGKFLDNRKARLTRRLAALLNPEHQLDEFANLNTLYTIIFSPRDSHDEHLSMYHFIHSHISVDDRITRDEPWPGNQVIDHLVERSSGQFIYPSTVLKFVDSTKALPSRQLEAVLDPEHQSDVFSNLDALYTDILSSCPKPDLLKRILGLINVFETPQGKDVIADILDVETEEVTLILEGLMSLLDGVDENGPIRINHASLSDYLQDKKRSGHYFVDLEEAHTRLCFDLFVPRSLWKIGNICLGQFLLRTRRGIHHSTRQYLLRHWKYHFIHSDGIAHERMSHLFSKEGKSYPNIELCHDASEAFASSDVFCLLLDDPVIGDSKLITSTSQTGYTHARPGSLNAMGFRLRLRGFFMTYLLLTASSNLMLGTRTNCPKLVNEALRELRSSVRVLDQECRGGPSAALRRIYSNVCTHISHLEKSKDRTHTIVMEASQNDRFESDFVDLVSDAKKPTFDIYRRPKPVDPPTFFKDLCHLMMSAVGVRHLDLLVIALGAPALNKLIVQDLGDDQVSSLIDCLENQTAGLLTSLYLLVLNGQTIRRRRVPYYFSCPNLSIQERAGSATGLTTHLGLGQRGPSFSISPFVISMFNRKTDKTN